MECRSRQHATMPPRAQWGERRLGEAELCRTGNFHFDTLTRGALSVITGASEGGGLLGRSPIDVYRGISAAR